MTHTATAAVDSRHMLSSCQELEGHLFDTDFSRNFYNVLYAFMYECVCSVGSALYGNVLEAIHLW